MSEGTPLESLETGDVSHESDMGRMNEILADMNASGAEQMGNAHHPMAPMGGHAQPMPPMYTPTPPPPMMHQQQQQHQQSHYIPVDEPIRPRKKNVWSSALEGIRDPILVTVLFFVLSLPVLHTLTAKYAHWAFAVGGQLSWLGLIAMSILAGSLFGMLKGVLALF
jgi:hypothetical protein